MIWFAYCLLCVIFAWFVFFAPDRKRRLHVRGFTGIGRHGQEQRANLWRRVEQCGGWEPDQAKGLEELIEENSKLKQLVAVLSLEKQVLLDNQMLKNGRRNP